MESENELINSRDLIKKCFRCKHNIECWELDREIPAGVNPRKMKLNSASVLKNFLKAFLHKDLKTGIGFEYWVIKTCLNTFNNYLYEHEELCHNYTTQIMAVIEVHANSKDCNWCCPGDDPEAEQNFKFEPLQV